MAAFNFIGLSEIVQKILKTYACVSMPDGIRLRHGWDVREYLNLTSSQLQKFKQMARKKEWGNFDNDYWDEVGEWNFDVYIETVRHLSAKEIDVYFKKQDPLNTEEIFQQGYIKWLRAALQNQEAENLEEAIVQIAKKNDCSQWSLDLHLKWLSDQLGRWAFWIIHARPDLHFLLKALPLRAISSAWQHFKSHYDSHLWCNDIKIRDVFLGIESLPDWFKHEIYDWFVMHHDLVKFGHPREKILTMHPETIDAKMMQALIALEDGDEKQALRLAQECVRTLDEGRATREKERHLGDAIYNWIYSAALYANRTKSAVIKSAEIFLRNESIWHKQAQSVFMVSQSIMGKNMHVFSPARQQASKVDPVPFLNQVMRPLINENCEADERVTQFVEWVREQAPFWLLEYENSIGGNIDVLAEKLQMQPLFPYVRLRKPWEVKLDRFIESVEAMPKKKADKQQDSESKAIMSFLLDLNNYSVVPRLQKKMASGRATKGRNLALSAFATGKECVTEQDRIVAGLVREERDFHNPRLHSVLQGARVVEALVGHPHVYDVNNPDRHLEITRGTFQLQTVDEKEGAVRFTCNCDELHSNAAGTYIGISATPNGLEVVNVSAKQSSLFDKMVELGALPPESFTKLVPVLEKLTSEFPIHSKLLKTSQAFEKASAESRVTLRIRPDQDNLFRVDALIRPLLKSEITCMPGKGLSTIVASVKGNSIKVERDLDLEKRNFAQLEEALGVLDASRDSETVWILDLVDTLQLLEIAHLLNDIATVEWPEGVKFKVSRPAIGSGDLHLSVNTIDHWFNVNGEVKIDAQTTLRIADLLEKIRQSEGSFIRLNDTEYVALTEELQKQLAILDGIVAKNAAKGVLQISSFHADQVNKLKLEGVEISLDDGARALLDRIDDADRITPVVPKGLQAELRDYQKDGFDWLERLSHWGAGALLADDMGLGKTVQTIALLLSQAPKGPSLVVVPTAVLYNWVAELDRFAPSLHPIVFNKEDREKVLLSLGCGDVLLTSYGVLAGEIEKLQDKQWNILVLDEAHTIKNRETKMSQAIKCLKSKSRVLLTGTPIQNHLSEVWNLFDVANPGFLGSFDTFGKNFILPIEHHRNRARQQLLKRLMAPFILRRTKNDVLDELPEKTEMTLRVELSAEERALYENIRQEALAGLQGSDSNNMAALAALTKLRQAACHPELVNSALKIKSSKTQAFLDLVEELIENRHRALVFSQFTSHLALVRRELDAQGIEYLYLDGSMTPTQRTKLVDQFQKGTMPLFLISLKAGGTGLNLTAADYVIHLDPWWNPAIEDQASDRAYRIGQQRPVSVYRLLAAGTIEDRIIELHQSKKSLADALLEGTEMVSAISKDEILKLIAEVPQDGS